MKLSRVAFLAFILLSFVAFAYAQDNEQDAAGGAGEEIEATGNGNLSDASTTREPVPQQEQTKPSNPSQNQPNEPKNGQDSQVNAGNIKVVLKSSKVIANPLTEGTKYKIALSWDMTFSQFIKRSGFRYSIGNNKFIRYGVQNRLMDPFQFRQSQRWMADDWFTLDKSHARLESVDAQIWFVTQNGQRWESQPFKVQVAENKGFFGLGKDNV